MTCQHVFRDSYKYNFLLNLLSQKMINAMLVVPNSNMYCLSAQSDPFVIVTNANTSPITLDLYGLFILRIHNEEKKHCHDP